MIIDNIINIQKYIENFPFLKQAFDFLQNNDLNVMPEKKYIINDKIYAIIENSYPKKVEDQKLEAHKKYIDLQYIISGEDIIGWNTIYHCKDIYIDYNNEKDIMFFNDIPVLIFTLKAGNFAFFFNEDAHSPLCGEKTVKKCIIKIKSELFKQ